MVDSPCAWPSAFAAPGLQPALCLHIPRGSFHQAPGRQRSSIAACPLPAHSRLLLGPSSLPFARLQTPKTPKTPKTLPCLHTAGVKLFRAGFKCARQLPPSLAVSLCCSRVAACPLPAHPSRQLPPSSWPSAFQHCSLPFACT